MPARMTARGDIRRTNRLYWLVRTRPCSPPTCTDSSDAAGYRDPVVPNDRPYRDPVHRHRRKKGAARDGAENHGDAETKPKRRPALWAELLMRTCGLDALHCPICGGRRELIALITQPHTTQTILKAMGLTRQTPVLEPTRPYRSADPCTLNRLTRRSP